MNITVLLAHPNPSSFNHAIAQTVVNTLQTNGHAVSFHDLYQEDFPPVIPAGEILKGASLPSLIREHCAEIVAADGIVVVHPNWWGQPPAILKGWIDRVLRPGVAYRFAEGNSGDGELIGLLKAGTVLVFNTADTPPEREASLYGDPLEMLWKNNMFISCGAGSFYRKVFSVVVTSTPEQRRAWLTEAAAITRKYFPKPA